MLPLWDNDQVNNTGLMAMADDLESKDAGKKGDWVEKAALLVLSIMPPFVIRALLRWAKVPGAEERRKQLIDDANTQLKKCYELMLEIEKYGKDILLQQVIPRVVNMEKRQRAAESGGDGFLDLDWKEENGEEKSFLLKWREKLEAVAIAASKRNTNLNGQVNKKDLDETFTSCSAIFGVIKEFSDVHVAAIESTINNGYCKESEVGKLREAAEKVSYAARIFSQEIARVKELHRVSINLISKAISPLTAEIVATAVERNEFAAGTATGTKPAGEKPGTNLGNLDDGKGPGPGSRSRK